jgi:hypothetical protein
MDIPSRVSETGFYSEPGGKRQERLHESPYSRRGPVAKTGMVVNR